MKPKIFCSTSVTTASVQQDVQEIHNLSLCRITPESTALNNTVQDKPIAWVYKYDVIKQTYLLGSQEKYSVWREGRHPTTAREAEGGERERGKRGKISQAELIPLEINNWRHSFCVWAQQRWLLKCHLGRNIEMKETPLVINYWWECVIVSAVVRPRGGPRLSSLTQAESPNRNWLRQS